MTQGSIIHDEPEKMAGVHREAVMTEPRTGKVRWFNPLKGYGRIAPEEPDAADIFIHISAVERAGLGTLYEGQEVTYEVLVSGDRSSAILTKLQVDEVLASDSPLTIESQVPQAGIEVMRRCTEQIVHAVQDDPKLIYQIHPAAFEDLVAQIFENEGFTVEFNKAWNQADGGVDIIAVRLDDLVPIRVAIQCKRYSQEHRVTAEPVRALAGVLDIYKAHKGVLATTGYFTKPAIEEARNYLWHVDLHDYKKIVAGLMKLRFRR